MRRRDFISSAVAAAAFEYTNSLLSDQPEGKIILASAGESDPALSVRKAVGALGGIKRFVKPGQKVMLLPNPQGHRVGASTSPRLVEEVIRLCMEAGAGKVDLCSIHSPSRWSGTGIDQAAANAGAGIWTPRTDSGWKTVRVEGAKRQKELRVVASVFESEVIISMPIAKHHGSTRFTGALKNMMGVNSGNPGWHKGTSYLVDSIVDLASAVRPHLFIVDATEILAENGPFGPGRTVKPGEVIAGIDPVAVDSYACTLLGMKPGDISTISQAAERGLGTMCFKQTIKENSDRLKIFQVC